MIDITKAKGKTYIWCNERLNAKTEGSKLLTYTVLYGGRGHLKIETRLRDESFESVVSVFFSTSLFITKT